MDTVSHAPAGLSAAPAEEARIRDSERQRCAMEVLLAADKLHWDASPAAIARYIADRTVDTRVNA